MKNPLIVAWWSAAFPGFGHWMLSKHALGVLLVIWEIVVNSYSHINEAILYSFIGHFAEAKAIADMKWLPIYIGLYIFAVWDSYKQAVETNKYVVLADHENAPLETAAETVWGFNYADKRNPWQALFWSAITPGLGHFYVNQLIPGVLIMTWWIVLSVMAHLYESIYFTLTGNFAQATAVLNPHWFLFLPSIYGYGMFFAYQTVVELNKFVDAEQARFLRAKYNLADMTKVGDKIVDGKALVVSTFDHSISLEIAIADLEQRGLNAEQIYALPVNPPDSGISIVDSIHKADGVSIIDSALAVGTVGMVLGAIWGFAWAWGPIICGLIGLTIGITVGLAVDWLLTSRKQKVKMRKPPVEVFLLVECDKAEAKDVETIIQRHNAIAVGRID